MHARIHTHDILHECKHISFAETFKHIHNRHQLEHTQRSPHAHATHGKNMREYAYTKT